MQTNVDGPRTEKINMRYFWVFFLPVLSFIVFGAILLMILKWPDDSLELLETSSTFLKNVGKNAKNAA